MRPASRGRSWGFLCPVHTPDGSPCGLLNHLTATCIVTGNFDGAGNSTRADDLLRVLGRALFELGMRPTSSGIPPPAPPSHMAVILDGCIIGHMRAEDVAGAVAELRRLKVTQASGVCGHALILLFWGHAYSSGGCGGHHCPSPESCARESDCQ